MNVRSTRPQDLDKVMSLESDVETVSWLGKSGRPWHRAAIEDPDVCHLLWVEGSNVLGFAVTAGHRSSELIELRRLVVARSVRRHGLGRVILRTVLNDAQMAGRAGVWLDVKPDNQRALKLYLSERFTPITAPPGTVPDPTLIYLALFFAPLE